LVVDAERRRAMTKQYYYDCPLQAAYMAKKFGVKFQCDLDIRKLLHNAQVSQIGTPVPRCYVKYEQELLFEPKIGDLCKVNVNDDIASEVSHDFCLWEDSEGGGCYSSPLKKYNEDNKLVFSDFVYTDLIIVQRNNKPFFMPERIIK